MSDVLLKLEENGGVLTLERGDLKQSNGLETAVVISLFGGNEHDEGDQPANPLQFWGNFLNETPDVRKIRSRTQHLLATLPNTTNNLLTVQQAVERDLQWMLDDQLAKSVDVDVSIVHVRRIQIGIAIEVSGERYEFQFTSEWQNPGRAPATGPQPSTGFGGFILVDDVDSFIEIDNPDFIQVT